MRLASLFVVNAAFNGLGAVVLVFMPMKITSMLGLGHEANFLWRLLAACSLSLAVVSFAARKFEEPRAVQAAVQGFLVFHGFTALVSLWSILNGLSPFVWGNFAAHAVFFALFSYFGLRPRQPTP